MTDEMAEITAVEAPKVAMPAHAKDLAESHGAVVKMQHECERLKSKLETMWRKKAVVEERHEADFRIARRADTLLGEVDAADSLLGETDASGSAGATENEAA